MSQKQDKSASINLRPAQPSDASQVSRLIYDTFPKLATYIFGLGDPDRAKQLITHLFSLPGHRFSYEFTEIAAQGQRIVGMFIAYPGKDLFSLNRHFARLLIKQYSLAEKLKLIKRGMPMIFIQEATRDEYLISNLAVKKGQRGMGIGTQLLSRMEDKAKHAGYHKLALMVTIDNQDARRFYEHHGFSIKAIHLESNQRVKHLGPGYQRMVKELDG